MVFDIVKLDPTTYLPEEDGLIRHWNSMIWTERYLDCGEFELRATNSRWMMDKLPLGTLISMRDTREVMRVEDHEVEKTNSGVHELVVRGRSAEAFLKFRRIYGGMDTNGGDSWKMLQRYTAAEASALLTWNSIVDPTPILNGAVEAGDGHSSSVIATDDDILPNVCVTIDSEPGAKKQWYHVEPGQVYDKVMDIMRGVAAEYTGSSMSADSLSEAGGFRVLRPGMWGPGNNDGNIVTFDNTSLVGTGNRGKITKTFTADIPKLRFDFYHGVDRTVDQTDRDPVQFEYFNNDLIDPKFKWSIRDRYNIVYTDIRQYHNFFGWIQSPTISGWDRRVFYKESDHPVKNGATDAEYNEAASQDSRAFFRNQPQVFTSDVEVNDKASYKYGNHYKLGDKVTLKTGFGKLENVQVVEFIRSCDYKGERGFPTLQSY